MCLRLLFAIIPSSVQRYTSLKSAICFAFYVLFGLHTSTRGYLRSVTFPCGLALLFHLLLYFLYYPHSKQYFLQNEGVYPTRTKLFYKIEGGKFSLHACEIVLKVKLFKKFEELHQISTRTHPTRKRKFHANEWVCPTRNSLFCKNEWGRLHVMQEMCIRDSFTTATNSIIPINTPMVLKSI